MCFAASGVQGTSGIQLFGLALKHNTHSASASELSITKQRFLERAGWSLHATQQCGTGQNRSHISSVLSLALSLSFFAQGNRKVMDATLLILSLTLSSSPQPYLNSDLVSVWSCDDELRGVFGDPSSDGLEDPGVNSNAAAGATARGVAEPAALAGAGEDGSCLLMAVDNAQSSRKQGDPLEREQAAAANPLIYSTARKRALAMTPIAQTSRCGPKRLMSGQQVFGRSSSAFRRQGDTALLGAGCMST